MLMQLWPAQVLAAEPVLVCQPQAEGQAAIVLASITAGITAGMRTPIVLKDDCDPISVAQYVSDHPASPVLLLGSAAAMHDEVPTEGNIWLGAVNAGPDASSLRTLSLRVSPERYFSLAKAMMPQLRIVHFAYLGVEADILPAIRQAANAHGIELLEHPIGNLSEAVGAVDRIVEGIGDDPSQAAWVSDRLISLNRDLIIEHLVEQSWDRFAAVFSDRIGSVSRGLLFAPYVDYESYGRWLAEAIQRENPPPGQFRFYDHPTPYAVNFRTARRLGIASNNPALSNASAVFPRSLAR